MVTNSELLRRINNLINIGTVVSVSEDKRLAVVDILGRKTNLLPVISGANSFKKKATPVRVGEQVAVFCPNGNSDFGFVLGGIFNSDCKEPAGFNKDVEITQYEDGTTISYDVKAKELKIDAVGKITIICKDANITANSVVIDSGNIDLGTGGKGVVTGECECAFTGLPHHSFSSNTRSKK